MIKHVLHEVADDVAGPADTALAVTEAKELHTPATRAPETAVPELMGLRTSAVRHHRHKVPLKRLAAMRG
ncbi:hypothetical protein ABZV31_31570 [Streptomyces sp. NPDC005202]|uniref:hypothetical protein n=1 Tax=Streptomyces sp. NPDC005202 TaxID=3157021 RepID=UPI0033AB52B9